MKVHKDTSGYKNRYGYQKLVYCYIKYIKIRKDTEIDMATRKLFTATLSR